MKSSLFLVAALLAITARAAAPTATATATATAPMKDLPEGVVYTAVDNDIYELARSRLRTALAGGPEPLAQLMGLAAGDARVIAGPFFGIEIDGDNLKGRSMLSRGKYSFPIPGEAGLIVNSFAATDVAQKRFLAHYVMLASDFRGDLEIRRPTFDELALIWAWVSWDLDDPLLVAESPREKFVFDFDPCTGLITWVERLTKPCFTGQQDGKQVLGCHCAHVSHDARKWRIDFEALASCPAPVVNSVAIAAASDSPARPVVFLPTNDKDARTDAMLARVFAQTHDIKVIASETPGFRDPGKPSAGAAPVTPNDAQGAPIHGYVLFGSLVNADGTVGPTRILISTDQKLSDEILRATSEWRIEPATLDGKPVTVMFWQEWPF